MHQSQVQTSKNQCGTNVCSCKKNGLKCMSACGGCHGEDCNNKAGTTTTKINTSSYGFFLFYFFTFIVTCHVYKDLEDLKYRQMLK